MPRPVASSWRAGMALVLVAAAGCTSGPPLPKTYPASGKVTYKGGRPLTGGRIEFSSSSDRLLAVTGTIGADGAFKLTTAKDNAKADGAPEGDFQVTIIPPMVSDPRGGAPGGHRGVQPIAIPKLLRVEPRENSFAIELPEAPPKS